MPRIKNQISRIVILSLFLFQSGFSSAIPAAFAATNIGTNITTDGDVQIGTGALLMLGAQADPDPAGTNGAIYYNTTNNKFRCYENGAWTDCISAVASVALSSLAAALGANTINNGDNPQVWNWSLTTSDQKGFSISENAASTAGGDPRLLNIAALAGSTAQPLHIQNFGDNHSISIDDEPGDTTPFVITATGQVGIGTNTFHVTDTEKLKVESVGGSQRISGFYGDLNAPLYIDVQNRSSGASATSAVASAADDGTINTHFISTGIASSGFNDPMYPLLGPHDAYVANLADFTGTNGGNMIIGTVEPNKSIKFITGGGMDFSNERLRIDSLGNVGIGTTTAGSKLDVKGTLRLSGATSGFVGLAPAADAGSTTYTLPAADGASGQVISTDGSGILSWIYPTGVWQRIGTILSPTTAGDDVTTSGDISTSGTGTITSAGLLTGSAGATISGADVNLNNNSNFNTYINTGTSTGTVNIGSPNAGAIVIESASTVTLQGGANTITSPTGEIKFQAADSATTGLVKIGEGGAGSTTPDLFTLDVKSDAGDPGSGTNGAMYYNADSDLFRCYRNGSWGNCGSALLDTILAATSANYINNNDHAQVWNWSLTTADKAGFSFGENIASTAVGTSSILHASTLASSTAMPLFIENHGDGNSFRVDDSSSDLTPFLIDKDGNVAIGSNSFDPVNPERLKVDSGSTPSYNIITATGNLDNYLQINVKNRNSGGSASSDVVATADNGTESINYIDMGMNSSGYNDPGYSIGGPNDAYLYIQGDDEFTPGGNLSIGTATTDKVIKFHTGGTTAADERMRIDGDGNVGIATTSPGSELDVNGTIRLSNAASDYVGFAAPVVVTASTTYTLPDADGTPNQVLSTDGAGLLSWINQAGVWQRVGTILSPLTAGDDVTTSGDISTSGTGTITSAGLLTGSAGATISGAATSINDNSNFNTSINTGTSTGTITIGNTNAGAINIVSGAGLTLSAGAASNINSTSGDLILQPAGSGTTAYIKIGVGGAGSATPDLLALDVKSTAGDPATGTDGAMYYNDNTNKFRCYVNGSWNDCDTTGGTVNLQSAYNNGATITTSAATDIALTLTSGNFTASGAGSVNLTPTGASSFTSGGALTLTGGGASVWSTSSGALTITSAEAATWGTGAGDLTLQVAGSGTTANVKIGAGGAGSATPDLLGLDVKSSAGDPVGYNGAMYYNASSNVFRCFENGGWKDCGATGAGASTLQQAYLAGSTITTTGSVDVGLVLTSGNFTASGAGSVNLTPTGASSFTSGGALTLTGGVASVWGTSAGNLTLQAAGSGATANVQIGAGGAGSATPDLFAVDVKSDAGDPAGFAGAMYYNEFTDRFRCYENGAWKDCDGGVVASLQTAYNNGGTITTSSSNPIDFTLTNGNFTASGAGSVNLTPTGASSFTSGGALTLTGGAASTWGTSTGNLTLQAAGTGTTASLKIGAGGAGSATPDLLALDVKSTAGDPAGFNGAMYYNANSGKFRCYEGGTWLDCNTRGIGTAKGDIIAYTAGNSPTRLPVGSNGQYIIADSSQATGLRWSNMVTDNDSLDFAQFSDAMTVDANTSINLAAKNLTINDLTGGGALSMTTNAAALTLTAGAASTWSTSSGALTVDSAAGLNLGTTNSTSVSIGRSGGGAINLTTPSGVNYNPYGAVAGNTTGQRFLELAANGVNYVGFKAPDNIAANVTWTLPNADGTSGQVLSTNGTGGLTWSTAFTDPMTTRGDIVYRDATNTTARLGRGTAGQVLKSDGTDIAWATLTGTDVGLGNVTNEAQIAKSIGATKGDIIGYTASNTPVRVPVGALDGYVLVTDSASAAGIKWAATSVSNDSLDFAQFVDAMTLDASTSIAFAGNTLTMSGGALSINNDSNFTTNINTGTSTGAINIGSGTGAKTITIGNSTGATALILDAGTGGVKIGDSTATPITRHLSNTSSIDIASTAARTCSDTTITVTGAVAGDTVIATPTPATNGIEDLVFSWNAYVSAADTVVVRVCNPTTGALDPSAQTWRVDVWQH